MPFKLERRLNNIIYKTKKLVFFYNNERINLFFISLNLTCRNRMEII